jgi:hypothetical protein
MSEPLTGGGVCEASTEAAQHDENEEEIEHRGFPWSMAQARVSGRFPMLRALRSSRAELRRSGLCRDFRAAETTWKSADIADRNPA